MSIARAGGRVQPARPGDPTRVGPYRIIGRLGSGGMGTVHAGLDPAGTRVAVKVIHPAQAGDPEFRARFRREVQLSARVQGPCLIPLLSADPDAETPWLATAYAPGLTLNQHLAAHGPLADATLYAFAAGTAQALAAIHAAGVIHRDVKPQNVILSPAGPRVLDFGIAHAADGTSVTRSGVMTGTPGWISPEYYRTGIARPEGDMFAWGTLVTYAATGRLPFGAGAPDVVAYRVLSGEPDLHGLPGDLRGIVERALAKDPAERITAGPAAAECARLFATRPTRVLAGGTGPVPLPTRTGNPAGSAWDVPGGDDPAWHPPAPSTRRRTLLAVVAGAAVGIAAVGGFVALGAGDGRAGPSAAARGAARSAPLSRGSAAPADATRTPPADPRTAGVPADPLAGVADPAYTRSGDGAQPSPDEWSGGTGADSPRERDAGKAIRDRMRSILATKDMAFMDPTITFNERAQTVIVTGDPVPQLPDHYREMFRRAGEMAACTTLAQNLKDSPTTWPYGRFSVYWKTFDGDTGASPLGYGEAVDGCFSEVAGQWRGDESGMAAAELPSSDRAEIRVADAAVKSVIATWNANTALTNEAPVGTGDGINLGFDPVENAAYVWTDDPADRFAGRAARSNLRGAVREAVCRGLTAEFHRNRSWNYTRWSLAVRDAHTNGRQFLGSGTCAP